MLTPIKLGIFFFILCVLFSIFTFGVAYVESREAIKETVRDELETFAFLVSKQITADEIDGILPGDENTSQYIAIRNNLRSLRSEKEEIMSIYIWERIGDDLAILVDDDDEPLAIGSLYEADPEIINFTMQAFSGPIVDKDFTFEEWGASLSGYAPIKNATGHPIAILGVDMRMEEVLSRMNRVSGEVLIIEILGFSILLLFILFLTLKITTSIRRPKELFNQLFEHSADSILIIQDRKIKECNTAAEHLAERPAVELLGTDPFSFIHPDDREQAFLLYDRIERGDSTYEPIEVRSSLPGTSEKWFDIRSFPIQWKEKPAVLSIIRNITTSKHYVKALAESEERYASIVNNAPEPVVIHKEGIVLFLNRAAEKKSGYTSEELYGTNLLARLTPQSAADVTQMMLTRKQGGTLPDYEMNFTHKNGTILTLIVKGAEIVYQNQPVSLVHLVDITKRKQGEQALKKANQQLNLLTNITRHDILNGITALRGYLELLEDDASLLQSSGFIQKMLQTVLKIQEQIEFTKDYQTIGIAEPVWQNILEIVRNMKPPKGILIHYSGCEYEIFADLLLDKVFYNLLDNSIRHGEGISDISITCTQEPENLVIVYSDNGNGILPSEKENIFTRGWGKNTGYGMFLIREILSITDIQISETGKYGVGVRFEIIVPNGKFRQR